MHPYTVFAEHPQAQNPQTLTVERLGDIRADEGRTAAAENDLCKKHRFCLSL